MAEAINRFHQEQEAEAGERMLDAKDIARIWDCSLPRAYALMASGQLPVIRIGRSVRVPESKLREWIDAQVAASKSA